MPKSKWRCLNNLGKRLSDQWRILRPLNGTMRSPPAKSSGPPFTRHPESLEWTTLSIQGCIPAADTQREWTPKSSDNPCKSFLLNRHRQLFPKCFYCGRRHSQFISFLFGRFFFFFFLPCNAPEKFKSALAVALYRTQWNSWKSLTFRYLPINQDNVSILGD